jgi:hypothetical protein
MKCIVDEEGNVHKVDNITAEQLVGEGGYSYIDKEAYREQHQRDGSTQRKSMEEKRNGKAK